MKTENKTGYTKSATTFLLWDIDQWAVACGEFSGYAEEVQRKWYEKYSFEPGESKLLTSWNKNWDAAGDIWQKALTQSSGWR